MGRNPKKTESSDAAGRTTVSRCSCPRRKATTFEKRSLAVICAEKTLVQKGGWGEYERKSGLRDVTYLEFGHLEDWSVTRRLEHHDHFSEENQTAGMERQKPKWRQ